MPMPNSCIKCDKPALLLIGDTPYCVKHYNEEKTREENEAQL